MSNNTALLYLDCKNNKLSDLNISQNTALQHLRCANNSLSGLDISKNTALNTLSCYGNKLSSLDAGSNTALALVQCDYALMNKVNRGSTDTMVVPISVTAADGTVDLSTFPGFDVKRVSEWGDGYTVNGNILTLEEKETKWVFFQCGQGTPVNIKVIVEEAQPAPGDITADGKTDIMDVIRLLKSVSGWDVQINDSAADVTGDSKVDIMDVIRLLKYVSGWDVELN